MPEGDTVLRTARRLDAALAGAPLLVADLRWPSLATSDLVGMVTTEVTARGKHLLHRMHSPQHGDLTLHSHLRMEGQWRIARSATVSTWRRNGQVRALLGTEDWLAIGLRLGELDLVRTAQEDSLVGHLGPDILAPQWSMRERDRVVTTLRADDRPIGAALLDQRIVAGIGTMWTAESLFMHGVNPWTPGVQLGEDVIAAVVDRAQRLMRASADGDGTQGGARGFGPREATWVHARSGRPCRRCGDTIRVHAIGEGPVSRVMFACPTCQGRAPGDDGRPQAPLGTVRGRRR